MASKNCNVGQKLEKEKKKNKEMRWDEIEAMRRRSKWLKTLMKGNALIYMEQNMKNVTKKKFKKTLIVSNGYGNKVGSAWESSLA